MGGESEGERRRKIERVGDERGKEREGGRWREREMREGRRGWRNRTMYNTCMYMQPNAMCNIQNSHLHVHGCIHVESLYNLCRCGKTGGQRISVPC